MADPIRFIITVINPEEADDFEAELMDWIADFYGDEGITVERET